MSGTVTVKSFTAKSIYRLCYYFCMESLGLREKENIDRALQERVTANSVNFDKETSASRMYSGEEVSEHWEVRTWNIGDTEVTAIGVMHVPETFLEFRAEIETVIENSDVVVNEFAPEALGFYDDSKAQEFSDIDSKFNDNYTLEELRQKFLAHERSWNLGTFHHEIELLAAKFNKDMVVMDMLHSREVQDALQHSDIYAEAKSKSDIHMEGVIDNALYTAAGMAALYAFLSDYEKPMTRRGFLKKLGVTGVSAALAGAAIMETTSASHDKSDSITLEEFNNDIKKDLLRDLMLADGLTRLADQGYKKVAFIYGAQHLQAVEENLGKLQYMDIEGMRAEIAKVNSDSYKIFRQSTGDNPTTPKRFVASDRKVWKRINKDL